VFFVLVFVVVFLDATGLLFLLSFVLWHAGAKASSERQSPINKLFFMKGSCFERRVLVVYQPQTKIRIKKNSRVFFGIKKPPE
jgi:hypothetical protein